MFCLFVNDKVKKILVEKKLRKKFRFGKLFMA